jgi:dTDP-4-amino-4,6-dideoxygalactose transaminase
MCQSALNLKHVPGGRYEEVSAAEEIVAETTGHEYSKIVGSGNSAILAVMSNFKGKVMVPDQGGWSGFRKMANFKGIETIEVPTDKGIINPDVLDNYIKTQSPEALFITSFAGYMAEQLVKDLYEVCEDNGVLLVEDASGSIGDPEKRLGKGNHAHVIIASTGTPKTVNVGSGGFITTDDKKLLDNSNYILKSLKADPVTCAGIAEEMKKASEIVSSTMKSCEILKEKLKELKIYHRNKRGINVCISNDNPKKAGYNLRQSLKVDGGGIVTVCPRYDRIKEKAVCIELKNLDVECLNMNNLIQISEIILESLT